MESFLEKKSLRDIEKLVIEKNKVLKQLHEQLIEEIVNTPKMLNCYDPLLKSMDLSYYCKKYNKRLEHNLHKLLKIINMIKTIGYVSDKTKKYGEFTYNKLYDKFENLNKNLGYIYSDYALRIELLLMELAETFITLKDMLKIDYEKYELLNKDNPYFNEYKNLSTSKNEKKNTSCSHIWVTTKIEGDKSWEGASKTSQGCIKCGFTRTEEEIMDDLLLEPSERNGIRSNELCDLNLAIAIYAKIKENYSDIDDHLALKYFEISLNNIRKIKVSEERKNSRAKRLYLNPKFVKWDNANLDKRI